MNSNLGSKFYNNTEENHEETDNYVTCPLLQLKYSRQKKTISSRLGQKAKSLKHHNNNLPLFENKTAEADLRGSFKTNASKKLVDNFDKLNLVQHTPSETLGNFNRNTVCKFNFRPALPLSTKRSLYNDKENCIVEIKKELKSQNEIGTNPCLFNLENNIEEIINKSSNDVKNDTYYESPETSKSNYNTNLFHSFKEISTIPESFSSFNNSNSLVNSSLSKKQSMCHQLNGQPENLIVELSTIAKSDNFESFTQSSTHSTSLKLFQESKQPICVSYSECVKCSNGNFMSVKAIHYRLLDTLGNGGSSIVYKVLHPNTNQVMAIKKVDLSKVEDIIAEGYLNEVTLLQNLQNCESVIRLFDSQYSYKEKILYMVMEKGDTDLSKLIRSTKHMSVHMIMYYWSEMLTTVNEIHFKGIIHSDLKPANFLLVSGRLKLIDFGIASKIQGDMTSVLKDVTSGTWNYMSPECIRSGGTNFRGHKINQKSDVWSLGCILYSLIYGKTPYSHLTNTWQKLQAITESKQNISFPSCSKIFTQSIPPVLMQTMELCLKKDVKSRPYVIDLLKLIDITVFQPVT